MLAFAIKLSRKKAYHGQSILCPCSHFCYASSSEKYLLFAVYLDMKITLFEFKYEYLELYMIVSVTEGYI